MSFFHIIQYRMHLKGHNGIYDQGSEKKIELQLVLWASSSLIFLALGHFLLVLVND